ncbi:hypothetical protein PG999_002891 [Apiospora kogelbergensis]|uniref:DUF7143 domain-containing protein n=1 Tax=Apiospora kogelbergensis TaxID=1337665 RepID=A0AAW0R9N4_9PEZI
MQYSTTFTVAALFASLTVAVPTNRVPFVTDKNIVGPPMVPIEPLEARQNGGACFITGNAQLPAEVATVVKQLAPKVKCNAGVKTLGGVPDVTSGGQTYSQIDFSKSGTSGLEFALNTFVTADCMADSNLQAFEDALDVYTATEAGLRSSGGNFATIKAPKFFLAMQIARIKTAQGNAPTDAANQVDHLAEKVTKNAGRVDASLIAKVNALAKQT